MATSPTVRIGHKEVGGTNPVFVIAEIANCHEGKIDIAREMVDKIAGSGVDAVKLQLHIPEAEMLKSHPKFHTQGGRSLSLDELKELKHYIESKGLLFLCTPFSREAADQLETLDVAAFKIGSGEVSDPDFIDHIARIGKPMIISTGMMELDELDEAVRIIKSHNTPLIILHAISLYPTPYNRLNLLTIPMLKERYQVPVGLSDHTPEIYSAIASLSLRPALIEKHYTLDRNTVGTSDHKVSLQPEEFIELVSAIRKLEPAMGERVGILEEEQQVIAWARHAVVSTRAIKKGETFTKENISTKRPLYDGIPAKRLADVVGKTATKDIEADALLHNEDVDSFA
jgi:N-acetylneuraminate synthase